MADVFHFSSRAELDASENLALFIQRCRDELHVFGREFDWQKNYWDEAGVAFGNVDQKSRLLKEENVLKLPFLDFAKAYFRYQQGHSPTRTKNEMRALKVLERALLQRSGAACLSAL